MYCEIIQDYSAVVPKAFASSARSTERLHMLFSHRDASVLAETSEKSRAYCAAPRHNESVDGLQRHRGLCPWCRPSRDAQDRPWRVKNAGCRSAVCGAGTAQPSRDRRAIMATTSPALAINPFAGIDARRASCKSDRREAINDEH